MNARVNVNAKITSFHQATLGICIFLLFCIEATNYLNGFSFAIYGNVLGFLVLFFLLFKHLAKAVRAISIVTLLFIIYGVINPELYLSLEPYKVFFYTLVSIIFSVELARENHVKLITNVFFSYLILSVILFVGFRVGVDADFGPYGRMQGLSSEPSALGLIICFLFWSYYKAKDWKKLLFVFFSAVLTISLIVYACLLLFPLIMWLSKFKVRDILKIFVCVSLLCAALLFLSEFPIDSGLMGKISDFAAHTLTFGETGRNTRAINTELFFEAQARNKLSLYIGNGPSYNVYWYLQNESLALAKNLPTSVFFDFGLLGVIVLTFFVANGLRVARRSCYATLYYASLAYCLVNSAGGIVNDIFLFSLLFLFLDKSLLLSSRRTCTPVK